MHVMPRYALTMFMILMTPEVSWLGIYNFMPEYARFCLFLCLSITAAAAASSTPYC